MFYATPARRIRNGIRRLVMPGSPAFPQVSLDQARPDCGGRCSVNQTGGSSTGGLRAAAILLGSVLAIILSGCEWVVMEPSGDVARQEAQLIWISVLLMLLLIIGFILPLVHVGLSPRAGPWRARPGDRCPFGPRTGWLDFHHRSWPGH